MNAENAGFWVNLGKFAGENEVWTPYFAVSGSVDQLNRAAAVTKHLPGAGACQV